MVWFGHCYENCFNCKIVLKHLLSFIKNLSALAKLSKIILILIKSLQSTSKSLKMSNSIILDFNILQKRCLISNL